MNKKLNIFSKHEKKIIRDGSPTSMKKKITDASDLADFPEIENISHEA